MYIRSPILFLFLFLSRMHYRSGKIETIRVSYPSLLPYLPTVLVFFCFTSPLYSSSLRHTHHHCDRQRRNKETRNRNLHFATPKKTLCLITRDRPHLQQTNHPHPREPTHPDKVHKHARLCSIKFNLDAILLNKLSSPFAPEWAS